MRHRQLGVIAVTAALGFSLSRLNAEVINSGGGTSTAANITAIQSIGEPVIGLGTTPSGQTAHAGFIATLVDPGTPTAPEIRLSASTVPFGTVTLGQFSDSSFTIFNDGSAALNITGLTGLPSDGFSFISPPATPFNINAGSSQLISVRFTPGSTGAHGATLHVLSNDSNEGDLTVDLGGSGAAAPVCFIDEMTTSADGIDLAGFITSIKVKHSNKTGTNKISGKLTINQLRLADLPTSPTLGVPSHTVSAYFLQAPDPCSLAQLPDPPLVSIITKAGKPGKPGLPAKSLKVKFKAETADQTTSKTLLIVLDPANAIPEIDKSNNFLLSAPLP